MKREDFGLEAHEPAATVTGTPKKTIKQMAKDERPQERALAHGIGSLTTPELLALILRVGQPGMPITELCSQLMDDNRNSLVTLAGKTRKQLMITKGIGPTKALQIEAIMEIMRRYHDETIKQKEVKLVKTSNDLYQNLKYKIGHLPHEEIWIVLLNRRNQILTDYCLTKGSGTSSVFDSKMIIKRALLEDAEGIAMAHNHPSGNLLPSPQDDQITRQLSEACKTMGFRMLDHVIVTAGGYYSYRDEGKIR